MSRARSLLAVAGVVLAAALPVAAARLRGPGPARCDRDGTVLAGTLRIRAERGGETVRFCSVRCAEDWLARDAAADVGGRWRVIVKDEPSGEDTPVAEAWFVRSRVPASQATGERIHAFARRADAEAHAGLYSGRILVGGDRPFGRAGEEVPER